MVTKAEIQNTTKFTCRAAIGAGRAVAAARLLS